MYATYRHGLGRVIVNTLVMEFANQTDQTVVNHLYWSIFGTAPPPAPAPGPGARIAPLIQSPAFSSFGATEQLTATVLDQNGATMSGASVAWVSSASSVTSVTSTGLVTAVADGTATITATSGSATGTASVIVQQAALPAGGEVSLADGAVNLVFPASAVSEAVVITAEPATGLPAQPVPIPGTAFAFGPDGTVFAQPVTLTIGYDPANVPQGVPEEELRLHELVGSAYVEVDAGVVDVANHTVSGAIDGFSVFAILRTLSVTTASLPSGATGTAYSQTLTAAGGDGNYTWALFNATTLPADLALNTETGEISGTPTASGTTDFEVEVTSASQTATKALAITIEDCTLNTPGDADGDNLPDCVETNTGVFVSELNTGTDPNNSDTDGDAISDGDEVLGTLAGLDLPGMGVSPVMPTILIEYDWFDDNIGGGSHTHRPTANQIAMVTASFAAQGVELISDYGQGGAFTGGNLIADADGNVDGLGPEYYAYKAANFDANRDGYFHYNLHPHQYAFGASTGLAEINGNDFITATHNFFNLDLAVASTIQHELGHNLNLRHGGDVRSCPVGS